MQKLISRHMLQQQQNNKSVQQEYSRLLKQYLSSHQQLRVTFQYCLTCYNSKQPILEQFGQYSPKQISKQILKPQLNQIKRHFMKFPNQAVKIQHFLIILGLQLNIPFQQIPKYLIGLTAMFNQLKQGQGSIILDQVNCQSSYWLVRYSRFFQYMMGHSTTGSKQEEQNTQFQVNFIQHQNQDYLLHDNGIRKIYFSKRLRLYLVLDERSDLIKIYNQEMRIVKRYQPNKLKHGHKNPKIRHFDFNQFSTKLGMVLDDSTIQLINLNNFMIYDRQTFQSLYLSYQIFYTQQPLSHIQFIQMSNKWLIITLQTNNLMLYNLEKPKDSTQPLFQQVRLFAQPKQVQQVRSVLEVVELGMVAIVAGNHIVFLDEKLQQEKIDRYTHGSNIRLLRYCQEKKAFFILAEQKDLTVLQLQRTHSSFRQSSYALNHTVKDFQLFPFLDTILLTDNQHYLHLYDTKSLQCYHSHLYSSISKKPHHYLQILKTSKHEFLIFNSYIVSLYQQKVAIQKQVEYNILPVTYFNEEELTLSINNQLMSVDLLHKEVRKVFGGEMYAMTRKYGQFVMGEGGQPIVVDGDNRLIYLDSRVKGSSPDAKDNKEKPQSIPRPLEIQQCQSLYLNPTTKALYILGNSQLFQISAINHTFHPTRQLLLQNFPYPISSTYSPIHNSLYLTTQNHLHYLINLTTFSLQFQLKIVPPKDSTMVEQVKCVQAGYLWKERVIVMLTNNNLVYLCAVGNEQRYSVVKLLEGVSYRQVDVDFRFIKMVVEQRDGYQHHRVDTKANTTNANNSKTNYPITTLIMLSTSDGHFLKLDLTSHIATLSNPQPLNYQSYPSTQTNKTKFVLNPSLAPVVQYKLKEKENCMKLVKSMCEFDKRHEKEVVVMRSIWMEKWLTLTIAKDGWVKVTGQGETDGCDKRGNQGIANKSTKHNPSYPNLILCMRLPSLTIKQSHTQSIQSTKISTLSTQILTLLTSLTNIHDPKPTPRQLLSTIKKSKQQDHHYTKLNHDEPIPIEIQKKSVEDLVKKEVVYETGEKQLMIHTSGSLFGCRLKKIQADSKERQQRRYGSSGERIEDGNKGNKTFAHPWRERKSFREIFERAPSMNKYAKKMPSQLLSLRRSLDMLPKQSKPQPTPTLHIIPQLAEYKFQHPLPNLLNPTPPANPQSPQQQPSQLPPPYPDTFQSCYYIKPTFTPRKSNINDFDEIDKQFYKKQANLRRRYIPKPEPQQDKQITFDPTPSKSLFKRTHTKRPSQLALLNYNVQPQKSNPISGVIELFEKHNREVAGMKYGRQIKITKDIMQMRNKSFDSRY